MKLQMQQLTAAECGAITPNNNKSSVTATQVTMYINKLTNKHSLSSASKRNKLWPTTVLSACIYNTIYSELPSTQPHSLTNKVVVKQMQAILTQQQFDSSSTQDIINR